MSCFQRRSCKIIITYRGGKRHKKNKKIKCDLVVSWFRKAINVIKNITLHQLPVIISWGMRYQSLVTEKNCQKSEIIVYFLWQIEDNTCIEKGESNEINN